jgi:hypothetical protein
LRDFILGDVLDISSQKKLRQTMAVAIEKKKCVEQSGKGDPVQYLGSGISQQDLWRASKERGVTGASNLKSARGAL